MDGTPRPITVLKENLPSPFAEGERYGTPWKWSLEDGLSFYDSRTKTWEDRDHTNMGHLELFLSCEERRSRILAETRDLLAPIARAYFDDLKAKKDIDYKNVTAEELVGEIRPSREDITWYVASMGYASPEDQGSIDKYWGALKSVYNKGFLREVDYWRDVEEQKLIDAEIIKDIAAKVAPVAEKYGLRAVWLFDIGFMMWTVSLLFDGFYESWGLYLDLREALGREIDLVSIRELDGDRKAKLDEEKVLIYEANVNAQ